MDPSSQFGPSGVDPLFMRMPVDTLGSLSISAVSSAAAAQREFHAASVLRHDEGSITMHVSVGSSVFLHQSVSFSLQLRL